MKDSATYSAPSTLGTVVIYLVFMLSGMSALIYQLIWERALFILYGTHAESVAVVVAAFMLGIGLGGLMGGEISRRSSASVFKIFAGLEAAIGLYGVFSLSIIQLVGQMSQDVSVGVVGLLSFLVVLIPTSLMGATLPLLVGRLVVESRSVGLTVSWLYSINTLGSALVCFLGAHILFAALGMQGSIHLAATINGLVVLLLMWAGSRTSRASDHGPRS